MIMSHYYDSDMTHISKDEVHVELSRKQKRLFLGGVGKDHDEETIKDEVRRALKRSSEFCDSICTPTIEIVEVIKRRYVLL